MWNKALIKAEGLGPDGYMVFPGDTCWFNSEDVDMRVTVNKTTTGDRFTKLKGKMRASPWAFTFSYRGGAIRSKNFITRQGTVNHATAFMKKVQTKDDYNRIFVKHHTHRIIIPNTDTNKRVLKDITDAHNELLHKQKILIKEIRFNNSLDTLGEVYDNNRILFNSKTLGIYDAETIKQCVNHAVAHIILNDNYNKRGTEDFFNFIDAVEKEGTHSKYALTKKDLSSYEVEAFCDIHGDIRSNPAFKETFKNKYPASFKAYRKIIKYYE